MIRYRKMSVSQAAKQVSRTKSLPVGTVSKPGSDFTMFPEGGKIGPNYTGMGIEYMRNPSYDGQKMATSNPSNVPTTDKQRFEAGFTQADQQRVLGMAGTTSGILNKQAAIEHIINSPRVARLGKEAQDFFKEDLLGWSKDKFAKAAKDAGLNDLGKYWTPNTVNRMPGTYAEGGEVEDDDRDDKDDKEDEMGKGGTIHIKKENRGKFNATKKKTGKSTEELTHSSNPVTKKRAIFAQNAAKWHHKADGGWIQEYAQGGRTINPAMGGYMIGGQNAYPPTVQYPPMYGFGGIMQGVAPFLSLIPGVGPAASAAAGMVGGMLDQAGDNKDQEEMLRKQKQQAAQQSAKAGQAGITGGYAPTFAWGGRLPETNSFSPSGLTLGHVPGYDSNSNYGGTNVPPQGWNYMTKRGNGEIKNWTHDTAMNVHKHTYPEGGKINDNREMAPVELEKQEVFQTPSGQMGQVNGPSHEQGGVDMQLPVNSFVWSDKLKASSGRTFAEEAAYLGKLKAKYEKTLKG